MARRPRSEQPIVVGDVRARPIRGRGARGPADGRWYWRAEWGRRTVWVGWGTREEATAAILDRVSRGIDGLAPRVADVVSVADLLSVWVGTVVDQRADLAVRSVEAIRGRAPREDDPPDRRAGGAVRRIVDGIGLHELARVTTPSLEDWVRRRQRLGHAAHTIRFDLGVVRAAWRWGRQVGATPDRELVLPRVRAAAKRAKRTPTVAELRAIGAWLREHAPPWCLPLLRLQAATGARIGEVAALRREDLDLEAGVVRLRGKTGERVVPVRRAEIALALEAASAPREGARARGRRPVATTATVWGVSVGTADQVLRYLHLASEALGIEPWTTHGLRRLAVDTYARRGVEPGVAAALLGHSPEVMLAAYRQVTADDLARGARRGALGFSLDDEDVVELQPRRRGREG